jgi:hypothetical protein
MSYNYFNPVNGPSYSSKVGLLGAGNPMAGGGMGGGMGAMNPWMSTIGGIGNIAGGLWDIFGSEDPSKAANPYLADIEGKTKGYLDPYLQAGMQALPLLQGQFKNLLSDPTSIMKQIGGQFQASPGYQYNVDQATGAANRAAAAGGMLGSPAEQAELAKTVSGIANQDYNNFMNQGLGLYGRGLQGEEGLGQMGYGAANSMVNALIQQLMAQAQNAYAGAANSNQRMGGGIGSIISGIVGL